MKPIEGLSTLTMPIVVPTVTMIFAALSTLILLVIALFTVQIITSWSPHTLPDCLFVHMFGCFTFL